MSTGIQQTRKEASSPLLIKIMRVKHLIRINEANCKHPYVANMNK